MQRQPAPFLERYTRTRGANTATPTVRRTTDMSELDGGV